MAEKSAAARFKSASERLERVKRKHDEQLKMNATLRQSVIELEQKVGDMLEEQKRKVEQEAGETSANAMILDDLKKSLRAKEEECDSLSMAKEKLEKYVQRALQATKSSIRRLYKRCSPKQRKRPSN